MVYLKSNKSMVDYRFKQGFHAPQGVSARVAAEELERIRTSRGNDLTAADVVDESRDESAPLHRAFEWDDSVAAERHREQQARRLIRAIVVFNDDRPKEEPRRLYVNYEAQGARKYAPMDIVVKNVDALESASEKFISKILELIRSAKELETLALHSGNESTRITKAIRFLEQAHDSISKI